MKRIANQNGFTLIEAMIAIGIFSIGFLAVASLQVNALNSTTSSRKTTEAMELASRQAEVFRGASFYPDYDDNTLTPEERFAFDDALKAGEDHKIETGVYTIQWEVADNTPLAPVPNVYTSPLPAPNEVTIAKTITINVFETRNSTRIMASLEMVKVWEQDG